MNFEVLKSKMKLEIIYLPKCLCQILKHYAKVRKHASEVQGLDWAASAELTSW